MSIIKFSKFFIPAWILSTLLVLGGLGYTWIQGGFSQSIDFSSGFMAQITLTQEMEADTLKKWLESSFEGDLQVQRSHIQAEGFSFMIKGKAPQGVSSLDFVSSLEQILTHVIPSHYQGIKLNINEIALIDPSFSQALVVRTLWLVLVVLILVLGYVWFRFKLVYAGAAILALIHDVLAVLAIIGILGIEISIPVVVSLFTIVGYSLNDTIVIFDRVRENLKEDLKDSFVDTLNKSLTQTLNRTLVTSFTTFIAVLMIALFTEGTVKDFAISFIVGIFIGTYSSLFIAGSLITLWHKRDFKLRSKVFPVSAQSTMNISFKK